jgi:hypothetical protein
MATLIIAVAPCQCFSPGGNQTTSPGRISSIGSTLALHPAQSGRDDQGLAERVGVPHVRAPGSRVTWPPLMRVGSPT